MAMTEEDRLQRQKNAAAYAALSQAQKKARIQSTTGNTPAPVEQPRIWRKEGENGTYQIGGTLTPDELARFQATNAAGQMQMAEGLYNTQQAGSGAVANPSGSQGIGNAQSYIDQLNNAKQQAILAQLEKSRQGALSGLQQERSTIQPKYAEQRGQVAAGSQQQARNFAEFMAARGGTSSGAAAQAELGRLGTLQGNLGSLGRQETAAFGDIARRESDIGTAYQSDVAGATAGIEADRMQALINQQNLDRQFGLQQAGLTGQYQGQQTLAGQQFGLQQQGQQFGQQMATQQLQRSNFESDRSYEMAKGQQEWQNALQQGQFNLNKAQQAWENTFKDKSFKADMENAAKSRGLQWTNMNNQDKARLADDEFREKQFEYTQEQDKIANNIAAGKEPDYDYQTDPVFIGAIGGTAKGELTSTQILNDATNIIGDIGFDGYNKLLAAARMYESSKNVLR